MRNGKRIFSIIIWTIIFSISAAARPGRNGISTETQPDGTTFTLISYGDEFYNVCKTSDGYAVMRNSDGWWHYASVDEFGGKSITEWKVGSDVPAEILSSCKNIPDINPFVKEKIRKARTLHAESSGLFEKLKSAQGTKAEGAAIHKHGIVLLAEFQDVKFRYTKEDFENLLNLKGYNKNGATGCAKEYFESQFGSSYEFDFVVSNILTLSHPRSYYGGNNKFDQDRAPEQMVVDACKMAADQGMDFSIFDQDNDEEIDNVFVIFAGEDEADYSSEIAFAECIWSHSWFIKDGAGIDLQLNGKVINRYACSSELTRTYDDTKALTGIGTFCHEYSHTFGLPDYYDTDYEKSNGLSGAMWSYTALMDSGNMNNNGNTPPFFNALDREFLGIAEPVSIKANGTYTMEPIGKGGIFYRIDTDNKDEYYLLECRSATDWDKYIEGSGMLIYHIDKSGRATGTSETFGKDLTAFERWGDYNEVNAFPGRQCADLIEADGRNDRFNSFEAYINNIQDISGIFYPNGGSKEFSAKSHPAMKFWSGTVPSISITNITRDGEKISFYVSGFEGALPTPVTEQPLTFQDAAIILFSSDIPDMPAKTKVTWGKVDDSVTTTEAVCYAPGKYSIILDNLTPATSYTVSICFETENGTGKEVRLNFMTSKFKDNSYPFISFKSTQRNADGSFTKQSKFPLRVWNCVHAADIKWFFNDKAITPAADGFYTPEKNGQLKAVVSWEDGSEDIVVKDIIIK